MRSLTCFDVWKIALPYILLLERVYNIKVNVEYITKESLKINADDYASLIVYIKGGAVCATVVSYDDYVGYEWHFLKYANFRAIEELLRKAVMCFGNEISETALLAQNWN